MTSIRATAQACPQCGTGDIIKYGTRKGTQIYKCKPCNVKFTGSGAMPGRRIPPDQVGAAVSMFYRGLSLAEIQRTFEHVYDFKPSTGSIYEWVVDYTRLALQEMRVFKPRTGDTWVADEMVLRIGGRKYWNWNVMDADSRYLLAAYLSPTRTTRDAETLFRRARANATRTPDRIVTDRLASYIDGIERVFGGDTRHVQSGGIRAEVSNNLSERMQGTIRQRAKVMRGLKRRDTAQLVMDGWALHYNVFRPHESIGDRTPASVAGVEAPFASWEDVARLDVRPFSHKRARDERLRTRPMGASVFRTRRMGR
jgi:putative transposase